ncbi:3-phosphoshikimate 1-carboxyvinyltransferase [Breznakiella homolactica]|uniref:3-phosphoshikimate 1-carboxyvinyltransferase n=1 Tax=Breznakiella homolactica TaxID=2798577 RepID=A0A7T7XNJ4_9SPIR|nr:3-phosphoshikimate 1-carboxyvinyltransferase [Breznakiella homolactica]QQO09601.1 3-phosphoshikimate 1-carboxyvinyltransferase [Breznakiella homolactica]
MRAIVRPTPFSGTLRIPASKSHTIRRLLIAAMADGISEIQYPLDSLDSRSCVSVCRALGADVEEIRSSDGNCPNPADAEGKKLVSWKVTGLGLGTAGSSVTIPAAPLDVGNSGTTLFLALAMAAHGTGDIVFTGDEQIQARSAAPLLTALSGLGVSVDSKNGTVPCTIRGPWKGGRVTVECTTSQYLSALLLAAPLAPAGTVTEIDVPLLNEKPYVEITLSYLESHGIPYEKSDDFSYFRIPGGASYKPATGTVSGDFSSAAFPGCAAAVSGGPVTLLGLDPEDLQGDKAVFDMLQRMGCSVEWTKRPPSVPSINETAIKESPWELTISREGTLRAGELDLNATPDLLPVLTAAACYASGETGLVNVAHARIKETDRIAVMARELGKLGAVIEELSDGLIVRGKGGQGIPPLRGGKVDGHGDHRVIMALAVAALGADKPVEIDTAERAAVTYPGFLEQLGADILE